MLFLVSFLITGCGLGTVKDYDSEKLEAEQISKLHKKQADPFNNPPTPSYVKVAKDEDEGVYIEVIKLKPLVTKQGVKLDVWTVNAISTNKESTVPKCVKVNWKLQDFEFESEQPLEFILKGKEVLNIGKMKQSIWSFDGALIAIPPSGYVDNMKVRDADFDKKIKRYTCEMLEEDIDNPKKDTDAVEM